MKCFRAKQLLENVEDIEKFTQELITALTDPDPRKRDKALETMIKLYGEELVEEGMEKLMQYAGATSRMAGLYAMAAIVAIKAANQAGEFIAGVGRLGVIQKGAEAGSNPYMGVKKGEMKWLPINGAGDTVLVYRDNRGNLWVYTPEVNDTARALLIAIGLLEQQWKWEPWNQ